MKIIPAIDLMGGQVVRLYRGDPQQKTVYSDDPVAVARNWEDAGADMLHIVDLDAALGRGSNLGLVREIAAQASVPVEIAGGLRSESAAAGAAGLADRIVVGTMAFRDRPAFERISSGIGRKKVVVSVDHMGGQVVVHGWQVNTGVMLLDAVRDFASMGFSEFLLTDVSRDGTMRGPDLEFLGRACSIKGANVIASGGISGPDDVRRVGEKNAFGVILGRALYENTVSIAEAKRLA